MDILQKHFKKDHVHMRLWTRFYGMRLHGMSLGDVVTAALPKSGSRTTPHWDNSPPDKNKAQLLPIRTTIPEDYSPLGQLPTRAISTSTTMHQDQYCIYMVGNCPGGELSGYAQIYICIQRVKITFICCRELTPN